MRLIGLPVLFLLIAARGAVTVAPVAEGACGVVKPTPDGEGAFVAQPDLHPLTQTGKGERFAVDAPLGSPVMCARAALLPAVNDAEIVLAGYPFMIAEDPGERIGLLEISDGKFRFRLVQGKLTAEEARQLAARLEEMHVAADKAAP